MEILAINNEQLVQFSINKKINNVFLSKDFIECFVDVKPFGIFSKDKQLKGVFILQQFKRLKFLKQLSNPSFTPNCQLYFSSEAKNKAKKNSEEKKVMQCIVDFLENREEQIFSISFPENWIDFQPFYWNNYKVITNYTYQISLSKSKEEIFEAMSTERRKNINKAQKDGVIISEIKPNKKALDLIVNTFNKQGKTINKKAIESILFKVANESNSVCFIASNKEGEIIAVSFYLFNGSKMTYLFGGYDSLNKHEGAGALTMWNGILYAKEKGFDIFDFEGSMVPKIENYFRGFGGNLVPYFRVNKAGFLIEEILKIKDKANF
jgi:hypothetical protein